MFQSFQAANDECMYRTHKYNRIQTWRRGLWTPACEAFCNEQNVLEPVQWKVSVRDFHAHYTRAHLAFPHATRLVESRMIASAHAS